MKRSSNPADPSSEKKKRSGGRKKKVQDEDKIPAASAAEKDQSPPGSPENLLDEEVDGEDAAQADAEIEERNRIRLCELVKDLTPEEEQRFEHCFRSKLPAPLIKKMLSSLSGSAANNTSSFIMAGIAKIYVGELVENARIVQAQWNEGGYETPLQPKHYREAFRRLKEQNMIPCIPPSNNHKFERM